MGLSYSSMTTPLYGKKKEIKILMVGLHAAGKTTILYRLKLGEVINLIPTIGFNSEIIQHKNINFIICDVGGGSRIPPLWYHYYYDNSKGVIFVVDSADRQSIELGREPLHYLLNKEELRETVLLVLANKQDVPNALTAAEIAHKLQLYEVVGSRRWYVQLASATDGTGLYEGLNWLSNVLTIPE